MKELTSYAEAVKKANSIFEIVENNIENKYATITILL